MPPAWKLTSCSTQPLAAGRLAAVWLAPPRALPGAPAGTAPRPPAWGSQSAARPAPRGGGAGGDPRAHRTPLWGIAGAPDPREARLSGGPKPPPDPLPGVPRGGALSARRPQPPLYEPVQVDRRRDRQQPK